MGACCSLPASADWVDMNAGTFALVRNPANNEWDEVFVLAPTHQAGEFVSLTTAAAPPRDFIWTTVVLAPGSFRLMTDRTANRALAVGAPPAQMADCNFMCDASNATTVPRPGEALVIVRPTDLCDKLPPSPLHLQVGNVACLLVSRVIT